MLIIKPIKAEINQKEHTFLELKIILVKIYMGMCHMFQQDMEELCLCLEL